MKRKNLNTTLVVIGVAGFFVMYGAVGTIELNMETSSTYLIAALGVVLMAGSLLGYRRLNK